MHHTLSILLTFLSLTLAAVDAFVIESRATTCNAANVAWVKQRISHPTYFCTWYLSATRTLSPLTILSAADLKSACSCITAASAAQTLTTVTTVPSTSVCSASDIAVITNEYKNPQGFCNFWTAATRTTSPIKGKSVKQISQGCKCFSASSSSSSTSKITSTSEASSVSTSKASSVSTSKTSSVSTLKSSTISTKKSSTTTSSSSSKKTTTTTTTWKTSTTTKPHTPSTSTKTCPSTPLPTTLGSFTSGLTSWSTTTNGANAAAITTSTSTTYGTNARLTCTYASTNDTRAALTSPHLSVCEGQSYNISFKYRFSTGGKLGGVLNLYDYGYNEVLVGIQGPQTEGGKDGQGVVQGTWGTWSGGVVAEGDVDLVLFGLECLSGHGTEGTQAMVAVDEVRYFRV